MKTNKTVEADPVFHATHAAVVARISKLGRCELQARLAWPPQKLEPRSDKATDVELAAHELWLWKNSEARASFDKGVQEAESGLGVAMDFSKFLEADNE